MTDESAERDRARRLDWFRKARFGLFVHWGLYSQLGRHEWVMNKERIPVEEYEKLADTWEPKPQPARDWAELAVKAGMKYAVMTTKHHEGFCLWDTGLTDYNAVRRGPGRDLVREFVDACRDAGLRIGFYHSLMDWHHPDGVDCVRDGAARRRFLDYLQGCIRELCTNYGTIDVFWHDVSWPLPDADAWETEKMNAMIRELQPDILINNRAKLPEDFGTPEETVQAEQAGRAWEACMTFNGAWGYMPGAIDWHSARSVVHMLRTATAGGGNLLLNIGPAPDGSIPHEAVERLTTVGRWVEQNGEAMYGDMDRADVLLDRPQTGKWTLRGRTAYYWCDRWPGTAPKSAWHYVDGGKLERTGAAGTELAIGGLQAKLVRASILASGDEVPFEQFEDRAILYDLPDECPDPIAGICVFKLEFDEVPRQVLGPGCVVIN
ncbi:MAG: alpha-L-fucosidase [Planctomycetota bacterium]